jgi:transposase-like protein
MISNYVNSLKPQLGKTWHTDELLVKMKGGESTKKFSNIAFLWNVMNKQNRFLIASKLSEHRDTEGAIKAFNEATHNANGQNIQEIHTDTWRACRERISKNFANVGHIATLQCGILVLDCHS